MSGPSLSQTEELLMLDVALERHGPRQLEILPVVSRADAHKLEGIVTLRDVLQSYGVNPSD